MWIAFIKKYWQVSIFQETPANTPYSSFLLGLITFFFYVLIVMQWTVADVDELFTLTTSLFAAATLLLSYTLYTLALLALFQVSHRIVQTLACLLACHTIVHLFAFPLLLLAPWFADEKIIQPLALVVAIVYLILTFVLTIWQFMITVHIYKHALGIDYFPAVLASIGLLACNILVVSFWR